MKNQFEIILTDKTIAKLSGNSLGRRIFMEQVSNKINYNEPITIILPKNVYGIGSSFIQGFFDEIICNIGIAGVEKQVDIKSPIIAHAKEYVMKQLI